MPGFDLLPITSFEIIIPNFCFVCCFIYTVSGTTSVQPRCPSGTYSNATQLTSASECWPCKEGYYCETQGLTQPTGPCDAGL